MSSYDNELAGIVAELNRAAPGSRTLQPASNPEALAGLDHLLTFAVRQNASDLLVIAGAPVTMRMNGRLSPAEGPDLTEDDARNLLLPLLTPKQYQELQKDKSIDICFTRKGIGRFRLNLHHQRGSVAGSIRVLLREFRLFSPCTCLRRSKNWPTPARVCADHRVHRFR